MPKKKKTARKKQVLSEKATQNSLFGLTRPQTQSLAVGIIIVGMGLFVLAGFAYKNRHQIKQSFMANQPVTPTIVPTMTISITPSVTPVKMITATSTAMLAPTKAPMVKKLPNTSSKVTYTVEEHDSLASIGDKLCASDRAWLSIAATNNIVYPYTIHAGETYIITCN